MKVYATRARYTVRLGRLYRFIALFPSGPEAGGRGGTHKGTSLIHLVRPRLMASRECVARHVLRLFVHFLYGQAWLRPQPVSPAAVGLALPCVALRGLAWPWRLWLQTVHDSPPAGAALECSTHTAVDGAAQPNLPKCQSRPWSGPLHIPEGIIPLFLHSCRARLNSVPSHRVVPTCHALPLGHTVHVSGNQASKISEKGPLSTSVARQSH